VNQALAVPTAGPIGAAPLPVPMAGPHTQAPHTGDTHKRHWGEALHTSIIIIKGKVRSAIPELKGTQTRSGILPQPRLTPDRRRDWLRVVMG
jgi:hypothetical protein